MSWCKANPCCGNPYNCVVPLPQDKSGLPHLNSQCAALEPTHPPSSDKPVRRDLTELVKEAQAKFDAMTPEQQAEHREAQRQSWIRGETGLGPENGQSTQAPAPTYVKAPVEFTKHPDGSVTIEISAEYQGKIEIGLPAAPAGDADDLVSELRQAAHAHSRASKFIADSKSKRNSEAEGEECVYAWTRPEETAEWRAAATITRLTAERDAQEKRVRELESKHAVLLADVSDLNEECEEHANEERGLLARAMAAETALAASRAEGERKDAALREADERAADLGYGPNSRLRSTLRAALSNAGGGDV